MVASNLVHTQKKELTNYFVKKSIKRIREEWRQYGRTKISGKLEAQN